ncbi:MAG: cytochrome c [Actinobacteria bacterium]|nr:cytochrome c [Actinomycetota bacterium]
MDTGQVFLIAAVVLGPAAILWAVFWTRQSRARKPAALLGIPPAMRPGAPDEKLEGPRLERVQIGGVLSLLVLVPFIVFYWLPERERQEAFAERFEHGSVERGELIYNAPPPLEEDISAVQFKEEEKALSLGQGCINCHGPEGAGGLANPAYRDPATGYAVAWAAPPLNNVFTRWDDEIVRFTIERGRPGTPMPTWGVEYGGSMTEMMIDDVMAYLHSIQVPLEELPENCEDPTKTDQLTCGQEIFEVRCAVCHGPEGSGREGRGTREQPWYPGMALWKGDVRHLPAFTGRDSHYITIVNGRRFAFMPPFGEAPAQGIPLPPNPLTEAQIRAVMAYERTL